MWGGQLQAEGGRRVSEALRWRAGCLALQIALSIHPPIHTSIHPGHSPCVALRHGRMQRTAVIRDARLSSASGCSACLVEDRFVQFWESRPKRRSGLWAKEPAAYVTRKQQVVLSLSGAAAFHVFLDKGGICSMAMRPWRMLCFLFLILRIYSPQQLALGSTVDVVQAE